jgi:ABC-2 type transport system ATP-binding protein
LIELKNVSKTLSGERIFENISLRVGNGECATVLCERDEQKILMGSILSGSVGVSDGAVLIGGYNVQKHKMKAAKLIGVVPSEGALYENMTVMEFLFFVAEAKEILYERINAKVKDVLSYCALQSYAERLIGALSYSARRRVLLAQAILTEVSALIICDSGSKLDSETQKIFKDVILSFASRGASVVILRGEDSSLGETSETVYRMEGTSLFKVQLSEKEDDGK